jgi:bacillithiol biosynthesis cysteine-adding enzyme BshC
VNEPTRSRVITEPLGGSPLSLAVQTRRLPRDLQPWWPSTADEWKEHARKARSRGRKNGSWYDTVRLAIAPSGAAKTRLERTVEGRGVIITTGQQAGLFGGPLYTLAKALTALSLADALERELGIPVAPVFWAATDDADFVEASTTYVADADGLHELRLDNPPPAGTPMTRAPLGDVKALLDELRKASGSAAHAAYYELARAAFTHEKTVGDAYVRLLRGLLEPLGVGVLDSSHASYHEAARPILVDALRRAPDVAQAAAGRADALRKLGFEPQVEDNRGLSLVFAIEKGLKRRLTLEEAAQFAKTNSAEIVLSPNVLLRPLVEREILPTIAYVGGPGELAYFVQSNAVAAALGREPVVGVPRWSCTIIEPFAERPLRRLGLQYHEVRDLAAVERRLAREALPESVATAWKQLQEQVRASVQKLGAAVQQSSLMPAPVIEGLERSLDHRLSRTERRLLAAAKRRDERVRRDLMVASAALFPTGKRQERVLNYIPMLARLGPDLLDQMKAASGAHARSLLHAERAEPVAAR